MKKRLLILCVVFCFTLVLSACGTPKVKSEKEIGEDLITNGCFPDEHRTYTIESIEITKRRTDADSFSDVVYATVTANSDDGTVQFLGEFEIYYELYNDGWFFESATVSSEKYTNLVGADFSEEELLYSLADWGYNQVQNLNVYDSGTDLENGTAYYSLTGECYHNFATEYIDVTLTYYFADFGYWDPYSSTLAKNSYTCDWNIAGYYFSTDENGYVSYYKINDNSPLDVWAYTFTDHFGRDIIYHSTEIYTAESISAKHLISDWTRYEYYVNDRNHRVSISGDFYSLSNFDYVLASTDNDWYGRILFIGKDHLAVYDGFDHDEIAKTVYVYLHELYPDYSD